MFWSTAAFPDPETPNRFRQWPWFTLVMMFFFVGVFSWNQWATWSFSENIQRSKENALCYYLKHDHLHFPRQWRRQFPTNLREHAKRIDSILNEYHHDETARTQAQRWLQKGNWKTNAKTTHTNNCLARAIEQGQLSQHPKRRIFVALAQLQPSQWKQQQEQLQQHLRQYQRTKRLVLQNNWALVTKERRWSRALTAPLLPANAFSLFWMLLALWIFVSLLERQIRARWLLLFWGSSVLGYLALLLVLPKTSQLLLGGHGGFGALLGTWLVLWGPRHPVEFTYTYPKRPFPGHRELSPILLLGVWFGLLTLDVLVFSAYSYQVLLTSLLSFGLAAGTVWLLQYHGLLGESGELLVFQGRGHQRSLGSRIKNVVAETQYGKRAQVALKMGQYDKAITLFRKTIRPNKTPMWVFEGLMEAFEKAGRRPKPLDYIQMLQHIQESEESKSFYPTFEQFREHYKTTHVPPRDLLNFARILRKQALHEDAQQLLEKLIAQEPDTHFYLKTLLLQGDIALEQHDLKQANQSFSEAKRAASQMPAFHKAIERGILQVQRQKATQLQAQNQLSVTPESASHSGSFDNLPVIAGVMFEESPEQRRSSPPSELPPLTPNNELPSIAPNNELHDDVLRDLELYEALVRAGVPTEGNPGESWAELPSLTLQQANVPSPPNPSSFDLPHTPTKSQTTPPPSLTRSSEEVLELTNFLDDNASSQNPPTSFQTMDWDEDDWEELPNKKNE